MSWVRLDDAAMDHPKILQLTDSQFRLWVKGLCYCQKHFTDGFIPSLALTIARGRSGDTTRLCDVRLWEVVDGGYLVHDYLDWNDSREATNGRKRRAKDRKRAWAEKQYGSGVGTRSEHIPERVLGHITERIQNASHHHTSPHLTTPSTKKDPPSESLSAPPRGTQHGRIFVHPWQLLSLIDTLGPHAVNFGLDEWVYSLSALADSKGLVLEKKAVWPWVQAQLGDEIRRRHLPIAGAAPSEEDSLERMREEIARQDAMVRRA